MTTITVNRKDTTFLNLNMREWFVPSANNTVFIKISSSTARRLHDYEEVPIHPATNVTRVKSVIVETE